MSISASHPQHSLSHPREHLVCYLGEVDAWEVVCFYQFSRFQPCPDVAWDTANIPLPGCGQTDFAGP